jgi:hypothetical protein
MNGKELWLKIFNTDLEKAVLSMLNLEKNFEDDGTDEENAEIVKALDGKKISDIVDYYLRYYGHGMDCTDIRYLLIELLEIDNIDEIKNWE